MAEALASPVADIRPASSAELRAALAFIAENLPALLSEKGARALASATGEPQESGAPPQKAVDTQKECVEPPAVGQQSEAGRRHVAGAPAHTHPAH